MALQQADSWLRQHRVELGLSLRMTVAGLLSFAIAHLFHLPQGYWAVLTAVIVTQSSLGGSLKAIFDRFVSTLVGAAWGAAVTYAVPHPDVASAGLAVGVALIPLTLLVAFRPSYRVAPVTAVIVLLGSPMVRGVVDTALDRVFEIGVGSAVALAVALTITPVRAHKALYTAAGDALVPMAEQIVALLGGVNAALDLPAVIRLHDRIRAAVEAANTTASEAARERRSYMSDAPDPEPLVRTLRRISHDLVIIGRTLPTPLPEPVRDRLAEAASGLGAACAATMTGLRAALRAGAAPPPAGSIDAAFAGYAEAMSGLRKDGLTRALPDADIERVFGLYFGLEELRRNLDELTARVAEMTVA
ncbi:MAG TPA: FUSC family protein [Stellaceae bacterium]|jgi:uncharacterized membrane protein YccC|nr:FUSC family protein [Stellaceae bacterium]